MKALRPSSFTCVSALLIVLAFPPWDLSFLIWVALVPFLLGLRLSSFSNLRTKAALVQSMAQGTWLSFFMTLGGYFWVSSAIREFGGVPWPLALLGLLIFSLFNQLQFWIFAPLIQVLHSRGTSLIRTAPRTFATGFGVAFAYVAIDGFVPKLFMDTLGHSLYQEQRLRQLAEIGGAPLLTLLIILVNWAITEQLYLYLSEKRIFRNAGLTASVLAICIGATVWGDFKNNEITAWINAAPKTLQVGVIQGNIGDFDKIAAENGIRGAADKVLSTLFGLSESALSLTPQPDVLVWPETTYPSTFRTPQTTDEFSRDQRVEQFVKDRKISLLFGGYDHAFNKDFNSFFFLSPVQNATYMDTDLQIYHKNLLLLFGEYMPLSDQIIWLRNLFPQVGNFGRGPGPVALNVYPKRSEVGTVLAAPIICYEALSPTYLIEAAKKGAHFILNITNDSWFGPWGEPHLHLALSTFRSIETRLPQVRSTNTGFSALIYPNGEIVQRTPIDRAVIMNAAVPILAPKNTLMKSIGDWFVNFSLGITVLFWAATWLFHFLRNRLPRVRLAPPPSN